MGLKIEENNFYKNITVNDFFYIFALILYITQSIIATSKFDILKNIFIGSRVNLIVLILLLMSMVYPQYTLKNKIGICIISVVIIIVVGKNSLSNKVPIIYSFLFVMAIYKKNLSKIIKALFFTYITLLLIMFIFSKLNIIENIKIYRPKDNSIRYGLGMTHPNTFYIYYFVFISIYIYIKKLKNYERLLIITTSYYIYTLTDSRTGFIMIIMLLLFDYLFNRYNLIENKFFSIFIAHLFSILTILSYILTISFDKNNTIISALDTILSHRITLMSKFYNLYGVNLWGNLVQYKTLENGVVINEDMILDNTYMYLLIDMGFIFTILLCVVYYKLLKNLIYMKLNKEIVIIIVYTIFSFTERLTLLQYNFSILLFFYLVNYKLCINKYNAYRYNRT